MAQFACLCLVFATIVMAGLAPARADKAEAPIPAATLAQMAAKGTDAAAPILLRAFKKEAEIELWKRNASGRFVHIRTYPICRWSGQLGPKTREGDRQTPEGFYSVAKTQMNPNSRYYLSFDIGYPNALDRSLGYTGSAVMVHGICSSMGCYAMTNAVAGELFAVAREAFAGGQAAFQFQSFPFRMTAANMARHRGDPNIAFWRQLKDGSDRFEATGQEVETVVGPGRYLFARLPDPAHEAAAIHRIKEEATRVASLIEDGAASVRTTYADGGQHPFWAAAIKKGFPVGPVSRPDTLALAGQEIVLVPERRKPTLMPEVVWAALIAPGTRFFPPRGNGFVPPYEAQVLLFATMPATYAAALPALLRASLTGLLADPPFETSAHGAVAHVAQR